tara:strand:+ start:1380 stop:1547 length:168 start_codon:yes stop_codon:yes gene_type:complete
MPVIEEEGGRLNAYAKEPRVEVLNEDSMQNPSARLVLICGGVLVTSLIALTLTIS